MAKNIRWTNWPGKYEFTGRTPLTVPEALEIKEELETIDRLLKQLAEAAKTARMAIIDLAELAEFAEPGDVERLRELSKASRRHAAASWPSGRASNAGPRDIDSRRKPTGCFKGGCWSESLASSKPRAPAGIRGRSVGEGAVELPATKQYEFGDSISNIDVTQSLVNALIRGGPGLPIGLKQDDLVVHRTRNTPKCATVVIMDMSGSMRYDGQYIHVKRMAMALDGLIRREYPGDYLQFVQMFTFAEPVVPADVARLMPNPPTIFDPVVRKKVDMSREESSQLFIPRHFTNIQHALQMARRFLAAQDTPNRQIILITDGLPTAHFEGPMLYLLYPPDPRTEAVTMREGQLCQREQITINIFLLPSWSQSREDVQFAQRLARSTRGRVFFAGGRQLDRYVLWDYVRQRRDIIA